MLEYLLHGVCFLFNVVGSRCVVVSSYMHDHLA